MVFVKEFRHVEELNDYLDRNKLKAFEIMPLTRTFVNPSTKLLTNSITYILIIGD
jgi:hypothetical protein